MTILCIYEAGSRDGLAAAWAARTLLGDDVEFYAPSRGAQPEGALILKDLGLRPDGRSLIQIADRDILVLGVAYPLDVLRAVAREARSVLLIHHRKAVKDLKSAIVLWEPPSWSNWLCAIPKENNLAAITNSSRCSIAGLTWNYLSGGKPRPRIIDLIEDAALGVRKSPRDGCDSSVGLKFGETRRFCAVVDSYDISNRKAMFKHLDDWHIEAGSRNVTTYTPRWEYLLAEGAAIRRARQRIVERMVRARRTMKLGGHVVPVANAPAEFADEVLWLLLQSDPEGIVDADRPGIPNMFAATYHDGADGKRHFSLRSPEGGADCMAIARRVMADQDGLRDPSERWFGCTASGNEHAAEFDAPLGWNGE